MMATDQNITGRYGMSAPATAAYDALHGVDRPISRAIASLLGAAQGTAPADRWQRCADAIEEARRLLDQATAHLAEARPDQAEGSSTRCPDCRRPAESCECAVPVQYAEFRAEAGLIIHSYAPPDYGYSRCGARGGRGTLLRDDVTCPACRALLPERDAASEAVMHYTATSWGTALCGSETGRVSPWTGLGPEEEFRVTCLACLALLAERPGEH